jgi:hypothetical protein
VSPDGILAARLQSAFPILWPAYTIGISGFIVIPAQVGTDRSAAGGAADKWVRACVGT